MTDVYARLKALNIELPPVVVPDAKFQPYVILITPLPSRPFIKTGSS